VGGVWLLLAAVPVVAHHSFSSEFDVDKPVTFQATVAKVEWINPHAWIHVDVKNPDGSVERWMIEAGTPNTLLRRGLNKNSLPVGMELKVYGFQAKDGAKRANGRDITLPDGKSFLVGGAADGPKN
jgi:hypothetical protein